MKKIMECAYCDGQAELKGEKKEREFRKEKFTVFEHYYHCENCNREFTTTETDELDVQQIYNQYREKHNWLWEL